MALAALRDRGLPTWFTDWYGQYILNRTAKVNYCGEVEYVWVDTGCPQGGVLSVTYWNLIFDELLKSINDGGPITCIGFADDGALLISGLDLDYMRRIMQDALNKAEKWARRFKLTFCPDKTQVMILHPHQKDPKMKPLVMGGKSLKIVDDVKYLGITIDKKLNFQKHITQTIKACQTKLFLMNSRCRGKMGPVAKHAKWIYTSVVIPALTYGCHIWYTGVNAKQRGALKKLTHKGARSIAAIFPTAPTEALEAVLQLKPLDLVIKDIALSTIARIDPPTVWDGLAKKKTIEGTIHMQKRKLKQYNIPKVDKTAERVFPTLSVKIGNGEPLETPEGGIEVYTDGSKTRHGTGAGVVIRGALENTYKDKLDNNATVFQAELQAIRAAGDFLLSKNIHNTTIHVHCDSKSALQALCRTKIKDSLLLAAIHVWSKIQETNKVVLSWIKAHAGHEGNEAADTLAKEGTKLDTVAVHTQRSSRKPEKP